MAHSFFISVPYFLYHNHICHCKTNKQKQREQLIETAWQAEGSQPLQTARAGFSQSDCNA